MRWFRPRRMTRRGAPPIDATFAGAACPPGSCVTFAAGGQRHAGVVTRLGRHRADVAVADGKRWAVPYAAVDVVERAPSHCTLAQVEAVAQRLLSEHAATGGLAHGWTFGFDLAPRRAGVCRYDAKRIDLSVSFCLRAPLAEVEDTLLHEIAHAIVGPKHGHDATWRTTAQAIGCSGARSHTVTHSVANWVGECGCGQQWLRERLRRDMAQGARCPACRAHIRWRRNVPDAHGAFADVDAATATASGG